MTCAIKCEANCLKQLAHALNHVLLRQALLDPNEVVHHLPDDLHGEQLPEEEVADELHVCKHLVLPPLHLKPQLFPAAARQLFRCRLEAARQTLELVLDGVQEHTRECLGLFALVLRLEFRVARSQCEDHVRIGLAVVWLSQRLREDDPNDELQLIRLVQFNQRQALDDGLQVVRADLVQQTPHLSLNLILALGRLRGPVGVRPRLEDILPPIARLLATSLHVSADDAGP
mmetsp:Transcript_40521/g.120138  ORF Transcript_40521/g.120138 Transcript_40521/m.120138 type:complete len:230 (-) Transcript_40521:1029-1718(-)